MADVKRTVVIDVQISNNINESLTGILSNLKNFAKDVSKISETIRSFADSLKEVKVSKTVRDTITSLTELSKVQIPDLTTFTKGIQGLAKASSQIKGPDAFSAVGHLATALKSIEGMKIPNIGNLFRGMTGIRDFVDPIGGLSKNIKTLGDALAPLQGKSVPGLTALAKGLENLMKTSRSLEDFSKIRNVLTSIKNLVTPLQGISLPDFSKFTKGLESLKGFSDSGQIAKNLQMVGDAMRSMGKVQLPGITSFIKGLEKLKTLDVGPIAAKVLELSNALKVLDKSGKLQAFATFAKDLNGITAQLNNAIPSLLRIQNAIKGVGEASRKAADHSKSFGERLTNYLQYRVIADTIFKMQEAFFGTIGVIRDFDQALYDLKAITGATDAETAKMGETIIDIASRSKFSASEVAEGMKVLGQAGFSATESIQAMGPIANLAMGTLESLGNTVDVVSTILRVFDMQASQTGHVVDVLANAINKSKLDIDKLRTAFNYVGPTAAEANISFEETSAAMMVLGNAGLRASTIGTGLRRLFSDLVDPSDKFAVAVEKAGYTLDDFNPHIHSLEEIFPKLSVVVSDAGDAFNIFGKLGANAVLTLKESGNGFQEMLQYVNTTGSAAAMAATQMEGLGVSYKNLLDKTQLLGVALGDAGLTGFLKGLVNVARNAVEALSLLINSGIGHFAVKATLAVTSTAALLVILGKLKEAAIVLGIVLKANLIDGFTTISARAASTIPLMTSFGAALTSLRLGLIATATSFKAFFFSSSLLSGVFAVAIVPLITWTAMLVKAISSIDDFAEAAEEASKKAIDFSLLQNGMGDYQKNIAGLAKDSEQYKQANLGLQKELYNTANGNLELSTSAIAAAQSINPLTGEIIDGGAALAAYSKELDKITLDKFVLAYKNAASNVESQTSGLARNWEGLKNNISNQGTYFSKSFAALFNKGTISENLAKAGNEINNIDFGTMVAENMRKGLDEGKVSWKDFSDYIQKIMQEGLVEQIPAQKDLLEIFSLLDEKSRELFTHLVKNGKIDSSTTTEGFIQLAESLNLPKEQLEALQAQFDKFKGSLKGAENMSVGAQLVKEFSEGKSSVTDFYTEYEKGGKKITEQEAANIDSIVKTRKELADAYTDYMQSYNQKLETGKLTEEDVKKRIVWEKLFEKAVVESNKAGFLNFQYHSLQKIQTLKEEYDKNLSILNAGEKKGLELKKAQFQLLMDYQKKVFEATQNSYSTKETTERFQTARKQSQLLQEQELHAIELAEAGKTEVSLEAERKRYEATYNGFTQRVQLAREEVAAIAAIKDAKPEDKTNAEQRLLEAEKVKTEYIRKELISRTKEETKATDDIRKLWEKNKDEFFKFNEAKAKSQRDLDNKIVVAQRELVEKIASIENKRVTDVKKVEDGILKIRQDAAQKSAEALAEGEEKIRLIRQRDMPDWAKESDNKQAAWKMYNEANALMEKAVQTKDQAMLDQAIGKYGKSSSLGENLKSELAATDLVRANMQKLAEAQKALGALKEEEKQKDIQRINEQSDLDKSNAVRDSDEKIQAARRTFEEQVKAENDRHEIEMKNVGLEMAEHQKKLQIAQQMLAVIKEYQATLQDVDKKGYGKISTPDGKVIAETSNKQQQQTAIAKQSVDVELKAKTDEVYNEINNVGQKAAEAGSQFGKSLNDSVKASSGEIPSTVAENTADAVEIAKNGYRIIYEDGKMIATNMTDAQRTAIQEMANAALAQARNSFRAITEDSRTAWEKTKENYVNPIEAKVDVNTEAVQAAGTLLEEMQNENITKTVDVDSTQVDDLGEKLNKIQVQELVVKGKVEGDDLKETVTAYNDIEENSSKTIAVKTEGTDKANELRDTISNIVDKVVSTVANVTGIDAVTSLKNAIDSLHDKTITITQIVRKVEENAIGGLIQKFAVGGLTTFRPLTSRFINQGSGIKDDVPAMLMKDEFVHRSAAVKKYGVDFMYKLNNLQIPKSIVQMFNKGGLVSNFSSGVVQMFSKGGSVLGLAKRKIEEFFGISSVNLNLGSMNINNDIQQTAKDAINPIGADAISKMSDAFKDSVAAFASGGDVKRGSVLSAADITAIQKSYAQQIAIASRNGQSQIVKILEKERDQIFSLSKNLDASIAKLEQEYLLKAELQRKIDSGEMTELDANYQLQKKTDEEEYQKQIESDEMEFAHDDLEFFKDKEDLKLEYENSIADVKKETKDSLTDYLSQLEEKKKEVDEYKKKELKQRELWETWFAFPKDSPEWQRASMQQLAEQYFRSYRAYDGKIQYLGPIKKERVQKALEKYNEETGDPLKKAKLEYAELQNNSPQSQEEIKLADLKTDYDKSLADIALDRANQVLERQNSISARDMEFAQKRMEADYNYKLEKKKLEKEAGNLEADARDSYSRQSNAVKDMFLSRINAVKNDSLSEIDKVRMSTANSIANVNNSATPSSSVLGNVSNAINDLLKRLSKNILRFNTGGFVPFVKGAKSGVDSIIAALTPREYVLNESAVAHYGKDLFDMFNNLQIPTFNMGGAVSNAAKSIPTASTVTHALDLSINGNNVGSLTGDVMTIDNWIAEMNAAMMRS